MKKLTLLFAILVAVAGVLLMLHLYRRRAPSGPVVSVENSFEFAMQAPLKTVAPLFGAWEERRWAGRHWDPQFVYPQPARDVSGEVFTVSHRHTSAVWVNTALDLEGGHIQYVYVIPGAQTAVIDIHLRQTGPSTTMANVVYRRTSLDPSFNDHVTEMGNHDRSSGKEWETAINDYLKK